MANYEEQLWLPMDYTQRPTRLPTVEGWTD